MRRTGLFSLALVLGVGIAIAAVVGTVSVRDRTGLTINELLRAETFPAEPSTTVDDHIGFLSEILGGTRQFTEADHATRFAPTMADQFTVEALNAATEEFLAVNGMITFVRVLERQPGSVQVLATNEDGIALAVIVSHDESGKITGIDVVDDPTRPRRLPDWESALILLAGWGLIAVAIAAWRYGTTREAWMLLAASIPPMAALLVVTNSRVAYTVGRTVPSLVTVFAVALLVDPGTGRMKRRLTAVALLAAGLGAFAPFVMNSSLIGHPSVAGALTDSEAVYRVLLVASAGLTALALLGVGASNIGRVGRARGHTRPALWVAAATAVISAVAAIGTAVDDAGGTGTLAGGPFRAVALSALAAVPAVVLFRLVSSQWERPEIAALVIDLETEGTDLRPALAKALGDPSLQLLTSLDGRRLLDEEGRTVPPEDIGDGRALTRIQSGQRLIGGLVHTSALQQDPVRIEAVAAAAGMALEVSRLNQQVTAQLDEVDASRARILHASDTARRQVERDLHDGAQQRLVALGLRLQRARRLARSQHNSDKLAALLEEATGEIRDTIEEIRAVSRGSQPLLLAERGLAAALDALAERSAVPVRIDITTDKLSADAETTAYYVIAEGLTNIAKHATATNARVTVARGNGTAHVTICDDGKGGAVIAAGSGLEGLNDRVAATGGTFDISTGPGGTTLKATIPCE